MMKRTAFLLFLLTLVLAPSSKALGVNQCSVSPGPTYTFGGIINGTAPASLPSSTFNCVTITLPAGAAVVTMGVTGTFSGTFVAQVSQDGGNTYVQIGGNITAPGVTSYVVAGFTNIQAQASSWSSGIANVNFQVSTAPAGSVTSGTTDPTGTNCAATSLYVRTTNGALYSCNNGVFAIVSGGGSSIALETNGTLNGSQTQLNLAGSANITVTDNGSGTDTFALTGLAPAPNTIAKVTSQWLDSYNQSTGNFTQSQPTFGDLAAGTNGVAIAANTPFAIFNAAVTTGLTATTNRPFLYRDATGNTEPTSWQTGDIFIGHNAAASGCSSFLEQHTNGGGLNFRVDCSGGTTVTSVNSTGNVKANSLSIVNQAAFATAPTIAAAGCGGSAAALSGTANGTISFNINVGTAPASTGCTVTMPTATTGWNCTVNDFTTISTSVFVQKQTASSTTSITLENFSDVAVATAPTANDIYHVVCAAN